MDSNSNNIKYIRYNRKLSILNSIILLVWKRQDWADMVKKEKI